jgi:glycine/D-amino acid oxidase-like deaminating enzyme
MPRLDNDQQASAHGISFTIDGETIDAVPGETIAAALAAAGHFKFREDRRGAPRGLFCGMGACFECRISVNGGPPQRACLTKVAPGMQVESLEYRERLPRAEAVPDVTAATVLDSEVLIVGAGPGGMSAAVTLAEAGKKVIVIDERPAAGGQYFKQRIPAVEPAAAEDKQYRDGAEMIERLQDSDAQFIHGATVWGAFRNASEELEICATARTHSYRINTATMIVATGAYESVPPFPGWTLPGVMTTGAVQNLVRAYRVAPAQRVLIAGNGPLNLQLACELIDAGIDVVAVAESAPAPIPDRLFAAAGVFLNSPRLCLQGMGFLRTLRRRKVPLHYGHHIRRAAGDDTVSSGTIAKLDRRGQLVEGSDKTFDVDTICLGYRLQPNGEILRTLGCRQCVQSPGVLVPERDEVGQTSIPGVYAIGDGAALGGAQVAIVEGQLTAAAILKRPGASDVRRLLRRHRSFQRSLWSMYRAADAAALTPDTLVCRCESVRLDTLQSLIESGVHDLGKLKRLSRAGMGPCQGRYCQQTIARLISDRTGSAPGATELFAPRTPVKPVTIAAIAAEKPDWHGFRVIELPESAGQHAPRTESIADTDVLIIGAGIIGISTALYLSREGVEVTLVERGLANGQASGGNAGSLHLQLLSFDFTGDAGDTTLPAAVTLPLQKLGIDAWQELAKELQVDYELKISGGIMLADNLGGLDFLKKKASLEKHFGVEVDILSANETRNLLPAVATHIAGAAFCSQEGKVNPLLATPALLNEALRGGAVLKERCTVAGIEYSRRKYRVATDQGVIRCNKVVNAAGGWSGRVSGMLADALPIRFAPQQMHVTQAVEPFLPYLLSLAQRHLTTKQTANGNLLIGGGWPAGFDAGSELAIAMRDSIEGDLWVAQRVIPQLGGLQMIRSWGAMGVMIDGAPIIGEHPGQPGFFDVVAANGYTMGPILGRIAAELVRTGRSPVDIAPFSHDRFH